MNNKKNSHANKRFLTATLVLAIVTFTASILNIVYHDIVHPGDNLPKAAEKAFRSAFLTDRGLPSSSSSSSSTTHPPSPSLADAIATAVVEVGTGDDHVLAGLSCDKHGGPSTSSDAVTEMVFWSDVPSDAAYRSPFLETAEATKKAKTRYLTFEPDHGGWNNIRMAMETVLVMAHAMGRTLVLPPEKQMYLLGKKKGKHKTDFSFNDFFHLDSIAVEHKGIEIITMEDFLRRESSSEGGRLLFDTESGMPRLPPGGRMDWNGEANLYILWQYLRTVGKTPIDWQPDKCILGIPASRDSKDVERLVRTHKEVMSGGGLAWENFIGRPTPVDGPVADRMREMMGGRAKLCVYDSTWQAEPIVHLKVEHSESSRLLTHFYAFLFFQDWRQDLYYKRFVRDHVRYVDEIVCAAARVVQAVRNRARMAGDPDGIYDSMHVRRGDFQYKLTRIPAKDLYERSKNELTEGATLYIATDERDTSFFGPFKEHYNVLFLDDFLDELGDINTNYYGMLDQLVASKGRVFYGTWWSTLSGYINRMRGYYVTKHRLEGYEDGIMQSYYFIPDERKLEMRQYRSVRNPIYMREFPTSWRDIDKGIDELHSSGDATILAREES